MWGEERYFIFRQLSESAKLLRVMCIKFLSYLLLSNVTINHFPNNKLLRLNSMWVLLSFMKEEEEEERGGRGKGGEKEQHFTDTKFEIQRG